MSLILQVRVSEAGVTLLIPETLHSFTFTSVNSAPETQKTSIIDFSFKGQETQKDWGGTFLGAGAFRRRVNGPDAPQRGGRWRDCFPALIKDEAGGGLAPRYLRHWYAREAFTGFVSGQWEGRVPEDWEDGSQGMWKV